ncbi:MAG: hypothetical protein ACE5MB_07030 [Anaerolineae bacterium]
MKKSLRTSIYFAVAVIVVGLALMLAEALTGATIETPGDVLVVVGRTLTFLQFGVPRTLPGLLGNPSGLSPSGRSLMVLGGALFLVVRRWRERSARP